MKTQNLNMLRTVVLRPIAGTLASFVVILVHRLGFDRKQIPGYRLLLCFILATAVAWAVACNDTGDTGGAFSGIVVDSISQAPIDSAWVSLSNSPVEARYTDSTGSFTVPTLGRPRRIYAGKVGYLTKIQSVSGTSMYVKGLKIELVSDTL